MPKALELATRYGKLTVFPNERRIGKVRAVCDCGNERWCEPHQLANGNTKCCKACLDYSALASKPNGKTHRPEYWVWDAMVRRCHDPKNKGFANYGARGIQVCDRWHTFENFLADMGPRPGGKREFSVERRDNDGPYSPKNCRWLPIGRQTENTRRSRLVTYHGNRVRFFDLTRRMSRDERETRRTRMDAHGWTADEAIDIPIGGRR